jgi:lactoylglutathione lyase
MYMRIMHIMIRVKNLDQSLDFYCNMLKMKLLKKKDYRRGEVSQAYLGYGEWDSEPAIELIHSWNEKSYEPGSGFGHIAIGVSDIYATCQQIKAKGGTIVHEPGPMQQSDTLIAFVKDPDGYSIELIEES